MPLERLIRSSAPQNIYLKTILKCQHTHVDTMALSVLIIHGKNLCIQLLYICTNSAHIKVERKLVSWL